MPRSTIPQDAATVLAPTVPNPARRIDRLFAAYGADHKNPINVSLHGVAVPMIAWSVTALTASLPVPQAFVPQTLGAIFNWSWPLIAAALIYYATLGSWRMTAAMAAFAAIFLALIHAYPANAPLSLPAGAGLVFATAWVVQFVGHTIEGRQPSFMHDLQFLLVGPAWVMSHVFKALGIRW